MPFLSEADSDQLRSIFEKQLVAPVRLRLLTQPPSKLFIPGQQLCASCAEAEPFVRELATLSHKLQVVVHNVREEPEVAQRYRVNGLLPAILLEPVAMDTLTPEAQPTGNSGAEPTGKGGAEPTGIGGAQPTDTDSAQPAGIGLIRFLGLPAGYEFSTLVADIVDVSSGHTDLSAGAQQEIRDLQQDVHLQVFVTPT